jgi:EAL domain-containing protein (putative c-di-GMP-specific phosphodiesterase class I)
MTAGLAMQHTNTQRHFAAGEILCRQGEIGECAFFLETGKVEIFVEQADGSTVCYGTRGAGSTIGELAIIGNGLRLATVRAIEDCNVLVITRHEWERRLANSDPVVRMFTEIIVARFREVMRRESLLPMPATMLSGEHLELCIAGASGGADRLRMASELKLAIQKDELSLRYQPMIAVDSGRVAGFEALLRWHHPVRGPVAPDEFIPVAEEAGQIIEITRWALTEACRALKRIERAQDLPGLLYMSVNFSSEDLASPDFVERVRDTLDQEQISPRQMRLEITERVMMNRSASTRDNLARCRADGCGIAIDDFGTGYSSLSYLNAYPIDTLKIDRSFIVGMHNDADAFGLVQSIIGLARTLRMSVVAEGVETAADLRTLRALGCDHAQGYYFSKPLAEMQLLAFLAAWQPGNVAL